MPSISELATRTIRAYQDAVRAKTISLLWPVYNVLGYGAVGDGVNDDAPAIQAAIDDAATNGGGIVFIPEGTYLLRSYISTIFMGSPYGNGYYFFQLKDNVTILGCGLASVLRVADNAYTATTYSPFGVNVFGSENRTNVHIRNLKIDCNGENNLHPGGGAIRTFYAAFFHLGQDCSVEDCYIHNCPGRNAILFGLFVSGEPKGTAKRAVIKNNTIHNGGSCVEGNVNQDDFTAIYCDWDEAVIENNKIIHDNEPTAGNGGIELHGNNQRAVNNHVERCAPGLYMVSDYAVWQASTVYTAGTIIVPTKAQFAGKRYICTTAGTSGAIEPTWAAVTNDGTAVWEEDGYAETVHQIVERNTFVNCPEAVSIWNSAGEIKRSKIINNKMAIRRFDSIAPVILYGIAQAGFNEEIDVLPQIEDIVIEGNEIYENAVLDGTNDRFLVGITISSAKNVSISRNLIHNTSSDPIVLQSSPRGLSNITVRNNIIHDFNISDESETEAGPAIRLNLTGSSVVPPKAAFDATNIDISDNVISNTTEYAASCGFVFEWTGDSTVTNLVVRDNTLTNIAMVTAGSQGDSVSVVPSESLILDSGYYHDSNGVIFQWMMVFFTAGAGATQAFSFAKAFPTECLNVQVTLQGASDAYATIESISATQVTVRCSASARTLYIFAVGE